MKDLLAQIAELHVRTAELKKMISETPGMQGSNLRDGIYQLEAAIYVMERNASDAYRALTAKTREAQASKAGVDPGWAAPDDRG